MEDFHRAARERLAQRDFNASSGFGASNISLPGGLRVLRDDVLSRQTTDHLAVSSRSQCSRSQSLWPYAELTDRRHAKAFSLPRHI